MHVVSEPADRRRVFGGPEASAGRRLLRATWRGSAKYDRRSPMGGDGSETPLTDSLRLIV